MNTTLKARFSSATVAALMALASASFAGSATAGEKEQPAHCYGINTCKGTSQCATAKNTCKGMNSCKGEGMVVKAPSECLSAGGTLTEAK